MLSNLKESVKRNEPNITLIMGVILTASIAFGIGLLIDFSSDREAVIIQNPTASIQQSLQNTQSIDKQPANQGVFVGSINSNKYHWPNCPSAKKIAPENQIWFSSEQEAKNAGYVRCGNFEKYVPANY